MINQACHRIVGQECDFTCHVGYKRKAGVLTLLCQEGQEEPEWDNDSPCEGIQLTLSTLGKIFSTRHTEIFFLFFPGNRI